MKEKWGIQDRWSLLLNKFKEQIFNGESASGIAPDDISKKDTLIEELIEKKRNFPFLKYKENK